MLSSYDPRLLIVTIVAALVLLAAIGWLLMAWRERFKRLLTSNEPIPCGVLGLCKRHHACADHACPGHPIQTRMKTIHLHQRSDTGQRVDTSLPHIPQATPGTRA